MREELAQQVAGIGSLAEPTRRELYRYVAASPDPVGREEAAAAVGIPAHSAKFHLDRLTQEGLLVVEYRRLSGRTGPGAGRPAKLYRRSPRELSVSVPERRYDLAGDVLACAVDHAIRDGVSPAEAVRAAARQAGLKMARPAPATGDGLARTAQVLARHGYEPRTSADEICLANCPFDRLAADHTELVCGLNLALVEGVIEGLALTGVSAELAPEAGSCCVRVQG